MPVLIAEGKKYRLGAVAGEDPLWNVSVDEKKVADAWKAYFDHLGDRAIPRDGERDRQTTGRSLRPYLEHER